MSLLGKIVLSFADSRVKKIEELAINPGNIQKKQLFYLLNKAKDTQFGRKYNFKEMKTIEDYQKTVPLVDYEGIKDWWNKYFEGEVDVTWTGKTKYWGLSSGTTSGNKLLPVTDDTIKTNKLGGRDSLFYYLHRSRDTKLFDGKMLFLGGSTSFRPAGHGTYIGDNTGIMTKHIPFYTKRYYSPGIEVATLSDWEEKINRTIEITSKQDIRLISGIPSWIVLLFEKLLDYTGKSTISDIWPNFSTFIHGGMSFKPYQKTFNTLVGKDIYYVDTYTATEGGMMGIQDRNDDTDMILITDLEVFYEFIPEEDLKSDNPRRFTVDEVETGVNYAIAISTNAGIWSYLVGDLVQFVSVNPHRYFFAGRTKTSLNAFGEHVIQEEIDAGIAHACEITGSSAKDYMVIPYYPEKENIIPRHRWLIEFKSPPADREAFIKAVDEYIKSRNEDYETHRKDNYGIDFPELIILESNTFYRWMEMKGKVGGQHKVPRVMYSDEEFNRLTELSKSSS